MKISEVHQVLPRHSVPLSLCNHPQPSFNFKNRMQQFIISVLCQLFSISPHSCILNLVRISLFVNLIWFDFVQSYNKTLKYWCRQTYLEIFKTITHLIYIIVMLPLLVVFLSYVFHTFFTSIVHGQYCSSEVIAIRKPVFT